MPFKIVTALTHIGAVDDSQEIVVVTSYRRCRCSTLRDGETDVVRLVLVQRYWPPQIKRAAAEVVTLLNKRGIDADIRQVVAYVRMPNGIHVGQKEMTIDVKTPYQRRTVTVVLRGTIKDFEINDKRKR